ncbi:radical SAM protein [Ruminococcus flavefaciens]|uniref:Radical SAM additional 4Fe4S-binding SPASM domain-containing protein n=1 Tax=Ruminococcus flavefaciens TaxID=1265 RepID=A0A1K1MNR4_RUMFL|nr:radical SAM protein [Ruminococcus flavefaciens]SFW24812.1 radical SAM additional 4Fe4S-binding SPASM domain-containing protein [Ruminococcus flavefaciens]
MKIIKNGDSRVINIINKKKLNIETNYRLSLYTYLYAENGILLIYNTLTFEVMELTEREWNSVQQIKDLSIGYDFIVSNRLEQLVMSRYIVETDYDEIKHYQETVFLLKTMAGQKKGISSYVILPTTGCNARCVYCYEEGYAVKTMTIETADRLVDFICETRYNDTVKLRWFGGEPLANAGIIRYICNALRERGVSYESSMVTNASLLTKELAHEANELWNLKKVQVSLDGAKEDYTSRKNYYNPEKHNYDVVMKAIHYLADEGIKISLRVNVDFDNIERIPDFLHKIKVEFGDMKNISLYIAPLFQEQHGERCIELYKRIFELTEFQNQLDIPKSSKGEHNAVRLRMNFCMADSIGKCVVITPDGVFNNCEHLPEAQTWGNIFDGVTDKAKFDELSSASKVDEKCAKCPFLPECTPFLKNGCPGWFEKCYEYHCLKTEHAMHNLLKGVNTETEDDDEEI